MRKLAFTEILDQYKVNGIYDRVNTLVTIHELFTDQKEDWYLSYQAPWMIIELIFIEELKEYPSHICYNHMRHVAEQWGGSAFKDKEFTKQFIETCRELVAKVNGCINTLKNEVDICCNQIEEHVKQETSLPLGFEKKTNNETAQSWTLRQRLQKYIDYM